MVRFCFSEVLQNCDAVSTKVRKNWNQKLSKMICTLFQLLIILDYYLRLCHTGRGLKVPHEK